MHPRLHRRQFILAPVIKAELPGWKAISVAAGRFAGRVHPDLPVAQAARDGLELTLLGYVIDPDAPGAGDGQVLERLLAGAASVPDLFRLTASLAGRWVLIAAAGESVQVFHDAAGLRQVHYTDATLSTSVCASQSGLIARELGLAPDREAVEGFLIPQASRDAEYWWPGDSSPYAGVRRLLPNHSLDLTARSARRYWPWEPSGVADLPSGIASACDSLRRVIVAGAERFNLALGLSAGLDSRTLLAASRELRHRLHYYSIRFGSNARSHPDLTVAARLVRRLGLRNHHWMPCPSRVRADFQQLYFGSVPFARRLHCPTAQAIEDHFPRGCVAMLGHCSEIARSFYRRRGTPERLDGAVLAGVTYASGSDFAARHFGAWLAEAEPFARANGYDVLDLFYWEQRCGSWLVTGYQDLDLVREVFVPFNCRDLLAKMLAIDSRYRGADDLTHREMIRHMWPEALSEPLNPPIPVTLGQRARRALAVLLRGLGLRGATRAVLRKFARESAPVAGGGP